MSKPAPAAARLDSPAVRFPLALIPAAALALLGCIAPNAPSCEPEGPDACRIETVRVRGADRTFVVSQRGALDCSAGPVAVVLAFHGIGDTGSGLRSYLGLEEALNHRALAVYPDGQVQADSWGNSGWAYDAQGADVAFFDAILARLGEDPCLDTARVFSVGHSLGGKMVEALSCHRPGVHRGYGQVAAGLAPGDGCASPGAVWITHGKDDATVPYAEGQRGLARWAARNGCASPEGQTFSLDACSPLAGCPADAPVVWCPSNVQKWRSHAPPDFAPSELAAFFSARF